MDIIPEPRDALPEILVPLAEPIVPYDGTDFSTFGERLGLTLNKDDMTSSEKTASILQSWLFFGLLSRSLGNTFRMDDYVKPSQKDRFLSLKNLPSAIDMENWRARNHFLQDCMYAATYVYRLDALGRLDGSPAGETGLAVLVLVKALWTVVAGPSRQAEDKLNWSSAFLQKHMKGLGWCPQQVAWAIVSCDPISACFLARLRRPSSLLHDKCTEDSCVANNVQLDSTYQQRHVQDGCTCSSLSVDAAKVKDIIRQGHIPLVSVKKSSRGQVSLKVTTATASSEYAAISHVWSDGLGNPTANAIPQCQAEMISNSLSRISRDDESLDDYLTHSVRFGQDPDSTLQHRWKSLFKKAPLTQFWLDTLCIPVSIPGDSSDTKADVDKLKLMAINQMGQIYSAASQILVLDSELQQVGSGALDQVGHIELLARLVSCAWMRRCWTLQEGALANKIAFQTAVGPMTLFFQPRTMVAASSIFRMLSGLTLWVQCYKFYKWWQASKISEQEEATNPIPTDLRYRFQQMLDQVINTNNRHRFFGQATPISQLEVFSAVWNHLAYRNTTKKEDLPAIFSNLLDTNVWKLLQHRPEERMKVLLKGTEALPVDLLFNNGPRALFGKDSLDRWVPSQPSRTSMGFSRDTNRGAPGSLDDYFSTHVRSSLRWTASGDLSLSPLSSENLMALVLEGNEEGGTPLLSFVIQIAVYHSGRVAPYLVRLHRPDVDELRQDGSQTQALILDVRDSFRGGGCLLRLTDVSKESHELVGRYDCPLTWELASSEHLTTYPAISCIDFGTSFKLIIRCG